MTKLSLANFEPASDLELASVIGGEMEDIDKYIHTFENEGIYRGGSVFSITGGGNGKGKSSSSNDDWGRCVTGTLGGFFTGALTGAGIGAAIGVAVSSPTGPGTAVGAASGATIGGMVGGIGGALSAASTSCYSSQH